MSGDRANTFSYSNVYPLGTLMAFMKDVGLRIRVQRDLREQFLKVCRGQDKPAAQVLREFMRRYVAQNGSELPNRPDRKTANPPQKGR